MSKIDYQALREAAQNAKDLGGIKNYKRGEQAVAEFESLITPHIVLALLDELERNQQYIKRPDQENEDIALTVGKLSVELEASENNLIDSECHVAELEEALRDKQALLEASEKRLRDWNAGLAQESLTYQQRVAELEVIKSAAEKLVRCKGRYHSEQNYRALAALFGVTVPDLPPLEAESVSQTYKLNELSGNSPVSPGGWISCSERMPNDAQWCVVDAADGYYVQCWSEGQGWLGDDISLRNCDVIRWMAIPEPPEQDGE
ncbi:ead/Ea22-like family protein [Escherichia coli]|uniref:ead/Ea22-like family protein n=1 Tax=Escherichia coli TaxID=562 RepID=UPI002DBC86CD|nr:ead/Ea22-like family protein [Escherichia coli]MEC3741518.1 ead/Ea22-like family protein [Escherichia coli]